MERPDDLPDYASPPIDEVVLGVHFDMDGFSDALPFLFWQTVHAEYPNFSTQQRVFALDDDITRPPGLSEGPSQALVKRLINNPGPRVWLEAIDPSFLLQLQDDMFTSNWRARGDPYPRFEALYERFKVNWLALVSFLDAQELRPPTIRMFEVAYVNWIPQAAMATVATCAQTVITTGRGIGVAPVAQSHSMIYMLHEGDETIGRLTVDLNSARRAENDSWVDGTQMTLTCRFAPPGHAGTALPDERYARSRDAIVQTFTDLTTAEARADWGQK